MIKISKVEFSNRIEKVKEKMDENNIDLLFVYGDEYRCENLRYLSNYWPIFERGMLAIGKKRDPVLLVSPECEHLAREMSAWKDIRLIREIGMSYVPEEVGFTNIEFTTISEVADMVADKTIDFKIIKNFYRLSLESESPKKLLRQSWMCSAFSGTCFIIAAIFGNLDINIINQIASAGLIYGIGLFILSFYFIIQLVRKINM